MAKQKKKVVSLSIPEQIHDYLKQIAESSLDSVSNIACKLILAGMEYMYIKDQLNNERKEENNEC